MKLVQKPEVASKTAKPKSQLKRVSPTMAAAAKELMLVQAQRARLQAKLDELNEQESKLEAKVGSLFGAAVESSTLFIQAVGANLMVRYTHVDRDLLDQKKAVALLTRAGIKVPRIADSYSYVRVSKVKAA